MKNRIEYWRLQLQAKEGKKISQGKLAEMAGFSRESINRWEGNKVQPELDNLVTLWLFFKTYFNNIDLQDLLEWE